MTTPQEAAIERLARSPHLAHAALYKHRHPNASPPFHAELITLWHSDTPRVVVEAFRGAAKSTLAEEAITTLACFRRFRNGLILGETFERAVERLRAVKHELEENEFIQELFGNLVGETWTEHRIVLANGVCIQAAGRNQSLRGVKHLDRRPDMAFGDDIEDEESVKTPEAREKTMRWLMSVVIPAMDPQHRIRINGTPLDPEAMLMKIAADPAWVHRRYPIRYVDPATNEVKATWPERFPLSWIAETEATYTRLGASTDFKREYLCEAEDPTVKAFTADMFKVEPTVRTWHATYAMVDPARTVKTTSATTGVVVFSWIANRLIVWDGYGHLWKPDEIIKDIFRIDAEYAPVVIGVERDGLEEFILQPLRQEQLRRSYSVPLRAMKAPKGKLDFIRGLQPFFKAGEVIFAKDLPQLRQQLLAFPTGQIDIPNALAYAMMLRPGQPIYDDFTRANVAEELFRLPRQPMYLAVNATQMFTTAVLLQMHDGVLSVFWDTVREGDPGATLSGILTDAGAAAGGKVSAYAPPEHFTGYDTIGLRGAAVKVPMRIGQGGLALDGRDEIRGLLRKQVKGMAALRVSMQARWTLNAFAGGYAKDVLKTGVLSEFAVDGPYKTLMEGLESFASMLKMGDIGEEQPLNWQTTPDGRRYLSSLARPVRR